MPDNQRTIDDYNRAEEVIGFPEAYELLFALVKGIDRNKMIGALESAGYATRTYRDLCERAVKLLDDAEAHMDLCRRLHSQEYARA